MTKPGLNEESGRLQSIIYPDKRQDLYVYQNGSYSPEADNAPGAFTAGTRTDIQTIVVRGTVDQPDGIACKTTIFSI
ncbi:MAG: hypothetical protein GY874_24230 [Desulfobacteraceae bacterium]|nr:hypothetical protein [Desulfobacteraceae bacterium]